MKIVAVVSGGLDSACYLSRYLYGGNEIHCLTFLYGQKMTKECEIAKKFFTQFEQVQEFKTVDISFMKNLWSGDQLTDDNVDVADSYERTVVVPLRNAIFITIATAYAKTIGANLVVTGSHLDDVTPIDIGGKTMDVMYPDCSPEFTYALQLALHLGHFRNNKVVEIWNPARMRMTKAENLKYGYEFFKAKIFDTWSCYLNSEKHCGECESCHNRKKAFIQAGIVDKTEYEVPERA